MSASEKLIQAAGSTGESVTWLAFTSGQADETAFIGDIVFDSEGNSYVFCSYGQPSNGGTGVSTQYLVVTKMDSDNTVVWQKKYNDNGVDYLVTQSAIGINTNDEIILIARGASSNPTFFILDSDGAVLYTSGLYVSGTTTIMQVFDVVPVGGDFILLGRTTAPCAVKITRSSPSSWSVGNFSIVSTGSALNLETGVYDSATGNVIARGSYNGLYANISASTGVIQSAYSYTSSDFYNESISSVIDSSGNRYFGTNSYGFIKESFTSATGTPDYSVKASTSTGFWSRVALSSDENYVYVLLSTGILYKHQASDGAFVEAMATNAFLTVQQPSSNNTPNLAGAVGIKQNNGYIYLLINDCVKNNTWHGNLIIIPESKFTSEYVTTNGIGYLTPTAAIENITPITPPAAPVYTSQTVTSQTRDIGSFTGLATTDTTVAIDTLEDLPNNYRIFSGFFYGRTGVASGTYTRELYEDRLYRAAFLPQENDIGFFVNSIARATSNQADVEVQTAGWTNFGFNFQNTTDDVTSIGAYKRFGPIPETTVAVPYSGDVNVAQICGFVWISGATSDVSFVEATTSTSNNSSLSIPPTPEPVTITNDCVYCIMGSLATSNRFPSAFSDTTVLDYTALPAEYGNDVEDVALAFCGIKLTGAQTFTPETWDCSIASNAGSNTVCLAIKL